MRLYFLSLFYIKNLTFLHVPGETAARLNVRWCVGGRDGFTKCLFVAGKKKESRLERSHVAVYITARNLISKGSQRKKPRRPLVSSRGSRQTRPRNN